MLLKKLHFEVIGMDTLFLKSLLDKPSLNDDIFTQDVELSSPAIFQIIMLIIKDNIYSAGCKRRVNLAQLAFSPLVLIFSMHALQRIRKGIMIVNTHILGMNISG